MKNFCAVNGILRERKDKPQRENICIYQIKNLYVKYTNNSENSTVKTQRTQLKMGKRFAQILQQGKYTMANKCMKKYSKSYVIREL